MGSFIINDSMPRAITAEEIREKHKPRTDRTVPHPRVPGECGARSNETDAEEVVNGTFAKVVEHIDDYVEQSAFFGWMCQLLMSEISHRTRRKSNSVEILRGDNPDVADPNAQNAIFREVDHSFVRSAIEELPESDREVLLLRYFMDIPAPQCAHSARKCMQKERRNKFFHTFSPFAATICAWGLSRNSMKT